MKAQLLIFLLLWSFSAAAQMPQEQVEIETAAGQRFNFSLEIATTPKQLEQGLMYRTDLPPMGGMLFLFPSEQINASFWMKNTLIPLDMLFIQSDGVIRKVYPNAKPQDLTSIPSGGPVRAVIELAGGQAEKLGIKAGDKVFSPSLLKTSQD
jgi:uncharacterized membrane protein (UPF0127 family)